jgi:hypothetical protein
MFAWSLSNGKNPPSIINEIRRVAAIAAAEPLDHSRNSLRLWLHLLTQPLGHPIDLLPDVSADSLAARLRLQKSWAMVATAPYADGATRGARQAVQVGDRLQRPRADSIKMPRIGASMGLIATKK